MNEIESFRQSLLNGLRGRGSHVSPEVAFEGLDWNFAGRVPQKSLHSIWQVLNHLVYWQKFSLTLLRDGTPDTPLHASDTWTDEVGPPDEHEWSTTLNAFLIGINEVIDLMTDLHQPVAARPGRSRGEVIGMLVGHNSYHLGQVVLLRQMLGIWPPTSGGDTW